MEKKCIKCGEYKKHEAKGLCKKCYDANHRSINRTKRMAQSTKYNRLHGNLPMSKNKACAAYLGIFVAEGVLHNVFVNVERMPYGHKGYDFICSKGMKIDVKSGCITNRGAWAFTINKNTIADYFLCLAFDNRDDLNPMHM